jgi:hypothetical protein
MDGQMTFEDAVRLNPSVRPEDAGRLGRQATDMLVLFALARRRGETVATTDLMRIAGQYNARLYEIRRHLVPRGFCIDKVRRDGNGVHHYAMVPVSESVFYKANWFKFA